MSSPRLLQFLCAAALLAVVALVAPRGALAAGTAAAKPAPSLLDRAKTALGNALDGVKKLGHQLVDHGEGAVEWAKKKWSDSKLVDRLYGFLRGNPIIQWVSKKGEQIVRRLERSAASMVGRPAPSPALPPFLQKLADWRKQRGVR